MGAIAGKIMIRPRGEYNPSEVYDILDVVKHNNKPWICRQNNVLGVEPDEDNAEFWMLLIDVIISDADTVDGLHAKDFAKASESWPIYTRLQDIGLTVGKETMTAIATALPNQSVLHILCNDSNNSVADGTAFPVARNGAVRKYGVLKVEKITADRVRFEFTVNDATENYLGFYRSGTGWGGWLEQAYFKDIIPKAAPVNVIFAANGWSSSAPYTQTVIATGITENDTPIPLFVDDGSSEADSKAKQKAYGFVSYFDSGNGIVTATCKYKKPETTFKVGFKGV